MIDNYDFEGDERFQQFVDTLIVSQPLINEGDYLNAFIQKAKQFYFHRVVQESDQQNTVEEASVNNSRQGSCYALIEELLSQSERDPDGFLELLASMPGYIPPRDIPDDVYEGQLPDTNSNQCDMEKIPVKPWLKSTKQEKYSKMTGGKYVGQWGHLGGEVKGLVTYALAPNRQRAYAGVSKGITNMFTKRIFGLGYVAAGLLPWYMLFQYYADLNVRNSRKNPNDGYVRSRGY